MKIGNTTEGLQALYRTQNDKQRSTTCPLTLVSRPRDANEGMPDVRGTAKTIKSKEKREKKWMRYHARPRHNILHKKR